MIYVYSSDSDPDLSEVHSSAGSPSVPGYLISSGASVCVVESHSHYRYLTPEEPVVLSAVSSVLISPNRIREDCVYVTVAAYAVFEVSPDTMGSVLTSPRAPPSSPMVSLLPVFFSPGTPISLDSMVIAFLLLPLPDGMVRVAVLAPPMILRPCRSAHCGGNSAPVVSFKGFTFEIYTLIMKL